MNSRDKLKPNYKLYKVLFVDDEEIATKYFKRAFAKDFEILTANSVAEALVILEGEHDQIGVVITDQRMPEEMGVELLKKVRENYPGIVRILTTAYTDIDDAIEAVNSGEIYRYITKPWEIDSLKKELYGALHLFFANRYEQDLLQEKRRSMMMLAGNIAHEMRTPLLSIRSVAMGLDKYLPDLIETYSKAEEAGLDVPMIREAHLQTLKTALERIDSESKGAQLVIDALMVNVKDGSVDYPDDDFYSALECINEAIERYPFKEEKFDLVHINSTEDFVFKGSKMMLIYVFFNMFKNALYAIAASGKTDARIIIEVMRGKQYHQVRVKDEGMGIAESALPYVFDDFYTTKQAGMGAGVGIGLSFCKRVMEKFGGKIECDSEEGKYTEFTLSFPVINDNNN